ncbi:MAG: hypothetical protein JSV45_13305 [Chromatiales bacterium]|nr:MAG: hypothetical protein JSV45_13305 [Chromatiales bacterium]
MRCEALDKHFFTEVRDLNVAFLRLLADPRAGEVGLEMLDLDPQSAQALAALDTAERRRLATVPVPLAGLRTLPLPAAVADQAPLPGTLEPGWWLAASSFAAGLLTYLWQLARHQPVAAALCVGPGQGRVQRLAALSFDTIQHCAPLAAAQLRARRIFSPELLSPLLQDVCTRADGWRPVGLDLIPLGLAGLRPPRHHRQRP